MKFLVVSDYSWPTGGIEQFVKEILARAEHEHRCRLLTWDGPLPLPVGFTDVVRVDRGDTRTAWAAMEWADCIVVVTSFNVRVLARLTEEYLQGTGKPAVTVVQTSAHSEPDAAGTEAQEGWLRGLIDLSFATVAVSGAVADALRRLAADGGVRREVRVIENASRLGPGIARRRGRTRLSFIGRPVRQKGFHLFERLALELGGGSLEFAANTVSIPPAGVRPDIAISWCLGDRELVDFFAAADLLVAPYLRADGLPLAILEAIDCGVPVLGFDLPPLDELLRRHRQALVPPTYEALSGAVRRWAAGELAIVPPIAGGVPGWDRAWRELDGLLGAAVEAAISA